MTLPRLAKANIVIRPFELADADEFVRAAHESIEKVGKWMSWCSPSFTRESALEWFASCEQDCAAGRAFDMGIFCATQPIWFYVDPQFGVLELQMCGEERVNREYNMRTRLDASAAIPAPATDEARARAAFHAMRALFDRLRADFPQMDTLSMGMSDDAALAIAEGSTMVRIGTALFGARPPKTTDGLS